MIGGIEHEGYRKSRFTRTACWILGQWKVYTRISGAGQGPVVRILDPMAPKTGSVWISRDTRFSFFGDLKEYGPREYINPIALRLRTSLLSVS